MQEISNIINKEIVLSVYQILGIVLLAILGTSLFQVVTEYIRMDAKTEQISISQYLLKLAPKYLLFISMSILFFLYYVDK